MTYQGRLGRFNRPRFFLSKENGYSPLFASSPVESDPPVDPVAVLDCAAVPVAGVTVTGTTADPENVLPSGNVPETLRFISIVLFFVNFWVDLYFPYFNYRTFVRFVDAPEC